MVHCCFPEYAADLHDSSAATDADDASEFEDKKRNAARFLLHCTTRYSLSYTAVDGIANLTEELVDNVTTAVATKVCTV